MWQAIKEDLHDLVGPSADAAGAAAGASSDDSESDHENNDCDASAENGAGDENDCNAPRGGGDENDGNASGGSGDELDADEIRRRAQRLVVGVELEESDQESGSEFGSAGDQVEESGNEEGGLLYKMGLFGVTATEELTPDTEAARRCELEETFTAPLLVVSEEDDSGNIAEDEGDARDVSFDQYFTERNDVRQFLAAFDVQAHTEEISELLATEDDDTLTPLQVHFQSLVPQTVSYQDFWARYYYRCDPNRIAREWEREDAFEELRRARWEEDKERALKEASDAIGEVGRSAAAFMGSVKGGLSGAVEAIAASPLVMAAMEEDEGLYYEEEEIEIDTDEEGGVEEKGREKTNALEWSRWTASDADDESVNKSGEVEVNFLEASLDEEGQASSLEVVRLRQSLANAEGERNRLLQTVEDRNGEMHKLRLVLKRSQSEHDCAEKMHDLQRKVEWLRHLLAAKSGDTAQQQEGIVAMKSILEQRRRDVLLQKHDATIQTLQSKIREMKELEEKLSALRHEREETTKCVDRCQTQLQELRDQQQRQAEEQKMQLEQALAASLETSSGSTMSSGVKVEAGGFADSNE
ncbi:hypothetical protein ACHAXT_007607 [Thalassiosira profunda]